MSDAAVPMAAHAVLGASSMKCWASCAGMPALAAVAPPSQDSEWGVEGTIAHNALEESINTKQAAAFTCPDVDTGRAVQVALDYVQDILDAHSDAIVWSERKVHVPSQCAPDELWGTCDIFIYVPSTKHLYVVDYKHGAGIYVEAHDNYQMKYYGVGALFTLPLGPVEFVTTTIVQPRCIGEPVRPVTYPVADILRFHSFIEEKALATLDPNAPLVPREDYCRWCPVAGAAMCPAAKSVLITAFDPTATDLVAVKLPDPKKLNLGQVSVLLQYDKLIIALLKAAKQFATGWVKGGNEMPGFKMVLAQAERAWFGKPDAIAVQLMAMLGKTYDEIMPRKLVTVTDAEEMLIDLYRSSVSPIAGETKKGRTAKLNEASQLARETLAMLTLKAPRGQPVLVPLSDPRPALETSAAFFAGQINVDGLQQE